MLATVAAPGMLRWRLRLLCANVPQFVVRCGLSTMGGASMPNELVKVPFHGDVIEAIEDERGVWCPLKRMCENLGLATGPQKRKLKKRPWAVVTKIVTTGPDGKKYKVDAIHLNRVAMWLSDITSGCVKEHLRPKLARYQIEAADVLASHFLPNVVQQAPVQIAQPSAVAQLSPHATGDVLLQSLQALVVMRQEQIDLAERVESVAGHVSTVAGIVKDTIDAVQQTSALVAGQDGRLRKVEQAVAHAEQQRAQAMEDLAALPVSDVPAPVKTWRACVNERVQAYGNAIGAESKDYEDIWHKLYNELYWRCQYNVKIRAENAGMRKLDVVDRDGKMRALFAIACEVLLMPVAGERAAQRQPSLFDGVNGTAH